MAELTGQKSPAGLDGISIWPALVSGQAVEHPPLYWEFHERGFDQAARIGDWKAVRNGADGPVELYDLKSDIAERHDLAARNPEVARRFESFLKSARLDSPDWPIRKPTPAKKAQRKKGAR
jgi:arylsulfatase A-like enzyme